MEYSGNQNALRLMNTQAVLAALKQEQVSTKQRLAYCTGLSIVTVNTALELLVTAGAACLDDVIPSNGGRPAQSYRFNATYRYGLALCIREQTLLIQVANLYGHCILREEEDLGEVDVARFRPTIERMLSHYPAIGAVCIGFPGVVQDGYVTMSDHPGLTGMRLAEAYHQWYELPVEAENDVNLAVLGYGGESIAYLYIPEQESPGVGVLLSGTLHRGGHGQAGEIRCLPPGINWRALDRTNFEAVCDAVAQAVKAYACILDPDRIVLFGSCLTEAHRKAVAWRCEQDMDIGLLPELVLAQSFDEDYQQGAVRLALELI